MRMTVAALALTLGLLWPVAVPADEPVPTRGMTMEQVKARFGTPERTRPPVGQPPITRWRYPGYTVYFEGNLCLHTVMDHQQTPPPLTNGKEEPSAGEVKEPSAGKVEEPSAGKVEEPSANEVKEPSTNDVEEPSASNLEKPLATEVKEPLATEEEKPSATEAEKLTSHYRFDPTTGRIELVEGSDAQGDTQDGD